MRQSRVGSPPCTAPSTRINGVRTRFWAAERSSFLAWSLAMKSDVAVMKSVSSSSSWPWRVSSTFPPGPRPRAVLPRPDEPRRPDPVPAPDPAPEAAAGSTDRRDRRRGVERAAAPRGVLPVSSDAPLAELRVRRREGVVRVLLGRDLAPSGVWPRLRRLAMVPTGCQAREGRFHESNATCNPGRELYT